MSSGSEIHSVTTESLLYARFENRTLGKDFNDEMVLNRTTESVLNITLDTGELSSSPGLDSWTVISSILYGLICLTGLIGNGLVIFVVLRYAKMKTVTNMYILNLAVADLCFLIGLPALIVTSILRTWVFGFWICKAFFISTSINWYTSVFTLTAMSADRYFAVCHAIQSIRYRTPMVSLLVCICVWFLSALTMLPMVLYTKTIQRPDGVSCFIEWPTGPIPGDKAFIWYAFLLGFFIPTALISIFYALVVEKLHRVGPVKKSKERKKSNKKVTVMVLSVITVYIVCWLPYWVFQIVINHIKSSSPWSVSIFQIITVLSYTNSMINPVLYAFLSENFRVSFVKAFKCIDAMEVNSTLHADMSMGPNGNRRKTRFFMTSPTNRAKAEMSLLNSVQNSVVTTITNGGDATRLIEEQQEAEPQDELKSPIKFVKAENGVHVLANKVMMTDEDTML